jgi:hypothetical protein
MRAVWLLLALASCAHGTRWPVLDGRPGVACVQTTDEHGTRELFGFDSSGRLLFRQTTASGGVAVRPELTRWSPERIEVSGGIRRDGGVTEYLLGAHGELVEVRSSDITAKLEWDGQFEAATPKLAFGERYARVDAMLLPIDTSWRGPLYLQEAFRFTGKVSGSYTMLRQTTTLEGTYDHGHLISRISNSTGRFSSELRWSSEGQLLAVTQHGPEGDSGTTTFEYDGARLVATRLDSGDHRSVELGYDARGLRSVVVQLASDPSPPTTLLFDDVVCPAEAIAPAPPRTSP